MNQKSQQVQITNLLANVFSRLERVENILSERPADQGLESIPGEKRTNPGLNVLVVDDDSDIRKLLRRALSAIDCSVFEAAGVSDALQVLRKEPLDLILLDIKMKDGSGVELLRLMSYRHRGVPTVVISGFLSPALTEQLLSMGVKKILVKPFRTDRVVDEVRKVLRNIGVKRSAVGPPSDVSVTSTAECWSDPAYDGLGISDRGTRWICR